MFRSTLSSVTLPLIVPLLRVLRSLSVVGGRQDEVVRVVLWLRRYLKLPGRSRIATALLDVVADYQPCEGRLAAQLAMANLDARRPQQALILANQGLRAAPGSVAEADLTAIRGRALDLLGRSDEALETLRDAVEQRPKTRRWRLWLVTAAVRARRYDLAGELLAEPWVQKLSGREANRLVKLLARHGQWFLVDAVLQDRVPPPASNNWLLGRAVRDGEYDWALHHVRTQDVGVQGHMLEVLAHVGLQVGAGMHAAAAAEAAIKLEGLTARRHRLWVNALLADRRTPEAVSSIMSAFSELNHESGHIDWCTGKLISFGLFDEAQDLIARTAANGDELSARILRIQLRLEQHNYESAQAEAIELLSDHPGAARAWAAAGAVSSRSYLLREALERYEAACALGAQPRVRRSAAQVAIRLGESDRAYEHLTLWLRARPRDPGGGEMMARVMELRGLDSSPLIRSEASLHAAVVGAMEAGDGSRIRELLDEFLLETIGLDEAHG